MNTSMLISIFSSPQSFPKINNQFSPLCEQIVSFPFMDDKEAQTQKG